MSRTSTPQEQAIRAMAVELWNIYRGIRENHGFGMPHYAKANVADKMAFRSLAKFHLEKLNEKGL